MRDLMLRTVLLAFLLSPAAAAEVDSRITVQGRLYDPATGDAREDTTADLTFRIYAAASGGSALWSEGPTTLPIHHGVFEAELGASVPLSSSVFAGSERWLEIQVEAETLSPRQRLSAVPFAQRAASAQALADGDTNYLRTGHDLQAGAVFHVSSATVAGTLNAYGTVLAAADLRVDGFLLSASGVPLTSAAGLLDASRFDPATTVPNAALDAASVTKQGNAVDVPGGLARLDGSGLVPDAFLDPALVTKEGNAFNGPSDLVETEAGGTVPDALLDVSSVAKLGPSGFLPPGLVDAASVTLRGNLFNAPDRLARLEGGGLLPDELIDVSTAAKLAANGRIPPALMDSSSVTLQGNVFNQAERLVRLDAAGTMNLPGLGAFQYSLTTSSSVNVTGTGAKVRENGADLVPKDAILPRIGACPAGYAEYTALRGRLPLGNCSGCTVLTTAGTAYTANGQTQTHTHRDGPNTGGSLQTGGVESLTNAVGSTMPYLQLRFCQKL